MGKTDSQDTAPSLGEKIPLGPRVRANLENRIPFTVVTVLSLRDTMFLVWPDGSILELQMDDADMQQIYQWVMRYYQH